MLMPRMLSGRLRARPSPPVLLDEQAIARAFREAIDALQHHDEARRLAIGQAVDDAYQLHARSYPTRRAFQRAPRTERLRHLSKFVAIESGLRDRRKAVEAAQGFALVRMWLQALSREHEGLASEFGNVLARLAHGAHARASVEVATV